MPGLAQESVSLLDYDAAELARKRMLSFLFSRIPSWQTGQDVGHCSVKIYAPSGSNLNATDGEFMATGKGVPELAPAR